ncbi:cyanophycinase, partial [Nodularia spumigena]|uniref:cyanophycinase n=1 Tax=Nodularia spumigena TaxID=70799 RepID=UPI002B20B474
CFGMIVVLVSLCVSSPLQAQGVVVAAGGGAEGDQGDTSSWSYLLYKKLIENGDKNNDGVIRVAILSTDVSDTFLSNYFIWIGQTLGVTVQATDYQVDTRAKANNSTTVGGVANADVIFIKGGDQGLYYDLWNETLLETHIRTVVVTRSGAIGGTSAGAMSLSQYSFSGGQDMISSDVLADAKTPYLNDASVSGTSGIHTDFFSFVSNVLFDTHFTQRGRLGRLIGIMAKSVEDFSNKTLTGIGLEQKTGIAVINGVAEVVGNGAVYFVNEKPSSVLFRDAGRPLVYADLRLDRLTHGCKYNLTSKTPVLNQLPSGTSSVSYAGNSASNSGAISVNGATETENQKFDKTATFFPADFSVGTGTSSSKVL